VIVADTSALISLTAADTLDLLLEEFDVHTTEIVVEELEDLASYGDETAEHADEVLTRKDQITVHEVETREYQSSRVDEGEGSCVQLTRNHDAGFLITDDLRALPELQTLTETRIAISPIVLKALVKRGVLDKQEALKRLEKAAEGRDWLGASIYRKARELFDE
jgi:predicted nucleic acid-binding protein